MAFCKNCGAPLEDGSAFCGNCGAKQDIQPQKRICPNCKNELSEGMVFCDKCGTRYPLPSVPPVQPVPLVPPAPHSYTPPAPAVKTTALTLLSVISIFLCWPAAIYGFSCLSRAKKASTQGEAETAVRNGTRACVIGLAIVLVVYMILKTL